MKMRNILSLVINVIMFMATVLFFAKGITAEKISTVREVKATIGVILDDESRVGKEAKVGIEMALDEFNNNRNKSFVLQLQVRNSQNKPWLAAFAARDAIDKHQVNVILGLHSWGEVSSVAEIASAAQVPILSLANSASQQTKNQWPFLIQAASANQTSQMQAVAAIIKSRALNAKKITFIYENTDPASSEINHSLNDALQEEIGEKLIHTIALSPFSSLSHHLERLKRDEDCKVFVLHSSLSMGVNLLENAKKIGMMMKGYVWIVTNTIMDHLHYVNVSTVSSMQSILGIKSYFPQSNEPKFQDFKKQFRRRFINEYPNEENHNPGFFAVQAYDATTAMVIALNECNMGFTAHQLVDKINKVQFNGLSGELQFLGGTLATTHSVFQVIDVIGNSNIAFWSYENGFSNSVRDEAPTYSASLRNSKKMLLPRRQLSTNLEPLRVLVPLGSLFKEFVEVETDRQTCERCYKGLSIDVFKATMENFSIAYEFNTFPENGTYDELVEQIHLNRCDAVAGDVTILENRTQFADFTQPYTESGLEMIVPIQSKNPNRALLFLKPFTKNMWGSLLGVTIYNGFVIRFIEESHNHKPCKGSKLYQVGTLIWYSFTTLFSVQGGQLHCNFSRMSMLVWLFVALIITQCYTASLSSMLTIMSIEPTVKDIETLKRNNMKVGYCRGSFVNSYLVTVLGFDPDNVIKDLEPDDYAEALKRRDIGALFLEAPYAKIFLARHCKSFMRAGDTFKFGGFGFAFRKDYPLLRSINRALLNISEGGKLKELEDKYLNSQKCVDADLASVQIQSLSLINFWLLFVATVGTSSVALVVYSIKHWSKPQESMAQRTSNIEEMKEMRNADKDNLIQESPEGTVQDSVVVHMDDKLKSSQNDLILLKEIEELKELLMIVLGKQQANSTRHTSSVLQNDIYFEQLACYNIDD